MTDIVLNCAGTTRTSGDGNPEISGETGKSADFRAALADQQEIAYYREYSDSTPGFENAIGIWNSETGIIERTRIDKSSNDGFAVFWTTAEQTISVVVTPEMLNALNPAIPDVSIDDLPAAAALDGTEPVPSLQGGDGVKLTSQAISGDPLTDARGLAKDKIRGFSDFSKTLTTYAATNGGLFGLEPYVAHFTGTGAAVPQARSIIGVPAAVLNMGSTDTGFSALQHAASEPFDVTKSYDNRISVSPTALPSVSGQAYTLQVGLINTATSLANLGAYFEITSASPNWFACIKNAGGTTRRDTGVALTAAPDIDTMRISYDPDAAATAFSINGATVETILNTTRVLADATQIAMACISLKSAGNTSPLILVSYHSFEFEKTALAYY